MYFQQITFGTPEYDEAVYLRSEVLRKPLGLVFSTEELALEHDHIHLGAYNAQGKLLAYLNLTSRSDVVVQMRQVAVDPSLQGQGIGRELVLASEVLAKQLGFQQIILHARDVAKSFYDKLGYATLGEPFEEVTIVHYHMEKYL